MIQNLAWAIIAVCVAANTIQDLGAAPAVQAPEYLTSQGANGMYMRVDIETGDVCITDIELGEWYCSEELRSAFEAEADEDVEPLTYEEKGIWI